MKAWLDAGRSRGWGSTVYEPDCSGANLVSAAPVPSSIVSAGSPTNRRKVTRRQLPTHGEAPEGGIQALADPVNAANPSLSEASR